MRKQKSRQEDPIESLHRTLDERHIKNDILSENKQIAQTFADHIRDPSKPIPPSFAGIPGDDESRYKYLLILDYLQTTTKMSSSVLKYESQHPDWILDREELARNFNLNSASPEPLITQMLSALQE